MTWVAGSDPAYLVVLVVALLGLVVRQIVLERRDADPWVQGRREVDALAKRDRRRR